MSPSSPVSRNPARRRETIAKCDKRIYEIDKKRSSRYLTNMRIHRAPPLKPLPPAAPPSRRIFHKNSGGTAARPAVLSLPEPSAAQDSPRPRDVGGGQFAATTATTAKSR